MIASNLFGPRQFEITEEQLHTYLRSKHWHEEGNIRNVATIWHRLDDEDLEILIPQKSARDYLPRMRQALLSLATYEKRMVADIVNDVRRVLSNVITVRIVHDDTFNGTIPINDGVLLITKARELLSSAAQSIYAKKKQFTVLPKEAKEYLESLLLGQTEVGSYIVNVIAPKQEVANLETGTAEIMPLEKAVTLSLITSLDALKLASEEYRINGDLKVFDVAVQRGVSANMCDALLGFSGEKHHREFEITVAGALMPMLVSEPRKYTFNNRNVELLQKVSEYYKGDYVLPQRRIIGHITKLSRMKDQTFGTIVIDSIVGEIERKVRVELEGDDYHMAVLAHDNLKIVKVEGDVHIKSKSAQLMNPINFGVIESEDLF
ncbi:hypothetical protein IFU01_06550 [Oxalobacteraceae sp. CFBP 8763]|nr:hypothetical protein [Oxalobacteraceae sp. CFBP 8763]